MTKLIYLPPYLIGFHSFRLNNQVKISTYKTQLTSENAISILSQYDVIIDATDNVATRYLLNDACIFIKKPLVSGSALQMEGQLTVYNYMCSPCYRCLYPQPPPPNTVNNCSSSGVLGPGEIQKALSKILFPCWSNHFLCLNYSVTSISIAVNARKPFF